MLKGIHVHIQTHIRMYTTSPYGSLKTHKEKVCQPNGITYATQSFLISSLRVTSCAAALQEASKSFTRLMGLSCLL